MKARLHLMRTALVITTVMMMKTAIAQNNVEINNYPPLNTTVQVESSNLPLVWITTTGTLSRTERSLGYMKVINNPDGVNYNDRSVMLVDQSEWKLVSVDSEANNSQEKDYARYAFDNDPSTFWHTEWSPSDAPLPHTLVVDMQQSYQVTHFTYTARQGTSKNGMVKDYEVYVSEDGENWGDAVLAGQFDDTKNAQVAKLPNPKSGRYLKFVALSEINGKKWTSAAEIGVYTTIQTADHPDQNVEFEGPISIKWRGSTSFGNDGTQTKKPMSVKLLKTEDLNGKKDKVKLLGMGKDSDWCFLAPWEDISYVRDVMSMQLARGGYAFAPQMRFCEVFMDGIYYGVFILCERASKGSKRLDVWDYGMDDDNNPIDDTTGDFLVEIDRPEHNKTHEIEPHYTSKYHPVKTDGTVISDRFITYQYKEPEEEDFADLPGAREALHKAIDDMEDAFAAEDYQDLYADYIDLESWMDYEIAKELSCDVDAYRLSVPMWKHSQTHARMVGGNDKWKLALWDFNRAYGNAVVTYFSPTASIWRYTTNDLMIAFTGWKEMQLNPFYWQKLMKDEAYVSRLKARYTQRRLGAYSDSRIDQICDSIQALLNQGAQSRDNKAWNNRFNNWKAEINNVKAFAKNRLAWMDARWKDTSLLEDVTLAGSTLYKDGAWNTICLPFRLNGIDGTPLAGATVKALVSSDYSNGTLTLNFTKKSVTSLEAGKPYIVKWDNGEGGEGLENIEDPVFVNTITTDILSPVETDYVDFVGTFSPLTLEAQDRTALFLGSSNTLYYPSADTLLGGYHAYFKLKGITAGDISTAGVNIVLNFDGEASSIEDIEWSMTNGQYSMNKDQWYTLEGIRLNSKPTRKGIYIHDGRKIVIK